MKNINKGLRILQCIRIIVLLLVLSVGLFLVSPIAQAFTFTTIDISGATDTTARGISSSGQIVGGFIEIIQGFLVSHGFLINKNGNVTQIDVPGSSDTQAHGINPSRKIVGSFADSSHVEHGFLLDKKGRFTTIDVPGSISTSASGINPSGDIVGSFTDSSGVVHGFLLSNKLRLKNAQIQELAVKGVFTQIIDVPGSVLTEANGINPSGDIVGDFSLPLEVDFGVHHGFLLDTKGNFTTIDVPDAVSTIPNAISPSGQIVGGFSLPLEAEFIIHHGFLLDTKGNLTTIDVPDAERTIAFAISPSGKQIIGEFTDSSGVAHGFLAVP